MPACINSLQQVGKRARYIHGLLRHSANCAWPRLSIRKHGSFAAPRKARTYRGSGISSRLGFRVLEFEERKVRIRASSVRGWRLFGLGTGLARCLGLKRQKSSRSFVPENHFEPDINHETTALHPAHRKLESGICV